MLVEPTGNHWSPRKLIRAKCDLSRREFSGRLIPTRHVHHGPQVLCSYERPSIPNPQSRHVKSRFIYQTTAPAHTSFLVTDHTRVSHAHARPLHPEALAFVPYGVVLVRVRVIYQMTHKPKHRTERHYCASLVNRHSRCALSQTASVTKINGRGL